METRLQAKKKALQMADSGDKETGISDLTNALQGLVDNLAQQEQRTVNITKVTGQTFKPDKFVPSLTESPKTWISKFQSWIEINKFDDLGLIKHSLRLLLPEVDLPWFDNLTINNQKDMFDIFVQYYQTKQPTWIIEQALWNKTMQTGEDLEQYISTIQSLANRLNKSDQEKTAVFVRGLPPHLRMPIVQKDPKSFEEATRCARLSQEALMIGSSPANYISNEVKAYMEKQQSVIDRLTERMAIMKKETSDPQVFVTSENSAKVTCQFCDKSGHTAKQCFRIRNKAKEPIRCFNCGREGHKQTQCRSKRKN
jgi:hypothetical protein